MSAHIPAILQQPEFRAVHACSKSTPFGYAGLQSASLQKFQSGIPIRATYQRPTTSRFVDVSLWRGLENRFFPRCLRYSVLAPHDRRALYEISKRYEGISSFNDFAEYFISECTFLPPSSQSVLSIFYADESTPKENRVLNGHDSPCNIAMLKRAFYTSKRFFELSKTIGENEYFSRIEDYYSKKDYQNLVSQLSFEQEVSQMSNGLLLLPYLPNFIDSLFYANLRHLPQSTFASYLKQFGVVNDLSSYDINSFPPFREKSYLFHQIVSNNTKTKVKKDYISHHPEFAQIYKQTLFKL